MLVSGETTTSQAENPKEERFQLVAQYPGQVKFSGPPRKRTVRPRRSNVEQQTLPGFSAGDDSRA